MSAVEFLPLTPPTLFEPSTRSPYGHVGLKSRPSGVVHSDVREVSSDTSDEQDNPTLKFDVDCLPSQTFLLERGQSTATFATIRLDLPSALIKDYDRLLHAWNVLAIHHHVLRTIFVKEIDAKGSVKFKQRVLLSPGPVTLGLFDDTNVSVGLHEPASLAVDWYRDIPTVYLLVQPAFVDRTSVAHLWKDFVSILTGGVPRTRLSFPDYASRLNQRDPAIAQAFWSNNLEDVPILALHSIPIGRQGSWSTTTLRAAASISSAAIRKYVKSHGVPTQSLIYTAFGLVLNCHCQGSSNVAVFVVEGRDATVEGAETVVGFADQQYPLKLHLSPEFQTVESLRYTAQVIATSSSNAFVGYDVIASEHQAARCDFRILVSEQDEPLLEDVDNDPFIATINFVIGDVVYLVARHDSCIPTQKMAVLLDHLMTAVANMMQSPTAPLKEISIISPSEKALIHAIGAATTKPVPDNVQKLFEEQVERTPDAPAAQFELDAPLSYVELNKLSNRVARQLPAGRGSFVPVCVQRSLNLVVALLSILKTGAAYVTLDPETPRDRNMFIVNDVSADFVVVDRSTAGRFPHEIIIEDVIESSKHARDTNLIRACDPSDPVYVIYTSGSTGKPKGVLHVSCEFSYAYTSHIVNPIF